VGIVKVVTLVPWRGEDELREQSWDIVRPYLERFGWRIYLGDREGPWSRGAAINAAARDAGNWDVAVIADADTIPPEGLDAAVVTALRSGGGVRPHDHLYRLTPSGSIAAANRGTAALEPRHIEREHPGGGFLIVAREGWDRVGGFDERFVGWGHEDSSLNIQLLLKADWDRIPGEAHHLWHPEPERKTVNYRRNRQLLDRMRRENAVAIRAAAQRKDYDIGAVL
jgi:hypothetical protein